MNVNTIDPRWKDLYTISGITAVMIEIILILTIFAVFIWPPYSPDSDSTESILMLLHNQPWAGLITLDLLLFVGNLLGIPVFLALYVALKEVNESYALIALVLGLIGISWIVPARPLSELLSLSDLYATATTEVAKVQYLAAAETFLASFNGTGWFLNTLFGGITYLISSFLMLRSSAFSKATAYVGIISNTAVFCFFIPVIGMPLLFLSVPGYLIWFFQLARTFFKMGRSR
jgi:hypothetical protein